MSMPRQLRSLLVPTVLAYLAGGSVAGDFGRLTLDVAPHWNERDGERGRAQHVAMPMPLQAQFTDIATPETRADGMQLLQLQLESPGALFMSAKFSRFLIPEGASVAFIARGGVYEAGPFTTEHVTSTGRFGTPMIPGDQLTIEVRIPAGVQQPELVLESVSHGYKDVLGMGRFFDDHFHDAEPIDTQRGGPFGCQRDIACPEGQPYIRLKDAIAEGYDGEYVCSGQLINNTRGDGRYLYITAAHCEWWRDPSTMTYYWDYANETCGGNDYPSFTYSTGSTDLFHSPNPNNDINLLELDGVDLEGDFDVYYAGWNRSTTPPTNTVAITHPADKPLQIAIDEDPAIDCAQGGCPGGWGGNYWRIDDYEIGVTEGGSSGGGLFDQDQLLVGVLTGGVGTNCSNFGWDEYYKISAEWAQLQPYLDPDNTGAPTVPGWDGSTLACAADLTGDGNLDIFDVFAYLDLFNAGNLAADFTGDGTLGIFDVFAFLDAFHSCNAG